MIKKIYIFFSFFLLLSFCGCKKEAALEVILFVDSIGIDYYKEENLYEVFYHIATSTSLITTELGQSNEEVYVISHAKGKTIYECMKTIEENTIDNIKLTHIQSFILSKSFLNNKNISELLVLIKTYKYIIPNFYVYSTDKEIKDIYSVENPEQISSFFSIITSNNYYANKNFSYFTNFVKGISEDTIDVKIEAITSSDDVWEKKDSTYTTLSTSGIYILNKDDNLIFIDGEDYVISKLITKVDKISITIDNINFIISDFKYKIKCKDNKIILKLSGNVYATNDLLNNNEQLLSVINNYLKSEIIRLNDLLIREKCDLFDINDYCYRFNIDKNNISIDEIKINFKMIN